MPRFNISALFLACFTLTASANADDLPTVPGEPPAALVDYGRQIFEFNFARPDKLAKGVQLGQGGNGLGPLFNETSCVGCHRQGGTGGSGGLESNVQLLGIVVRPIPQASVFDLLTAAQRIHPGLTDLTPVKIVQRFAVGAPSEVNKYDSWRNEMLASLDANRTDDVKPIRKKFGPVTLELMQRNTPALWGMGLIDRFRQEGGEQIRRRLAQEQREKHPWISGRPPVTPDGQEGWYGWRGQIATLEGIVSSACATEVGLQVAGATESSLPGEENPNRKSTPMVDLSEDQFRALVAFVQSIPKPESVTYSSAEQATVAEGEKAFHRIGCADCHVKDLGWVRNMYSDQLLHDMGDSDEDSQITATPPPKVRTETNAINLSQQIGYGAVVRLSLGVKTVTTIEPDTEKYEQEQEWKTPPLWGVADSAPYYHDGRAPSLRVAIEIHGGEAERSATAFKRLDAEDQDALLAFLGSLKAPEQSVSSIATR